MKDLYSILGVPKTASEDEIKKSYRELAKKYHPDRNADNPSATERFKEIGAAFEILGDPDKRKLYDEFGDMATKPGFDPEQARQYASARGQQGGWNFNGSENFSSQDDFLHFIFGDIFSSFGKTRNRSHSIKGEDLTTEIQLDFKQAVNGDQIEIQLNSTEKCRVCHGAGRTRNSGFCHSCEGQGIVRVPKTLKVRIPPGAQDGKKIRVRGQGSPSPYGGNPGDLLLTVRVKSHDHFTREGNDIHFTLPITIEKALLGTKLSIQTPLGKSIVVSIPRGSNGNTVLRIKGHGVQNTGGSGDFIIHLSVVLPDPDSGAYEKAARTLSKHVELKLPDGVSYN
ncbi:MAG: DnaJ domain-containing protein [Deltaproteobacteria bacterium]|nr:DnaJ domain-containing protein [Deltaproteobacteria bacterium]